MALLVMGALIAAVAGAGVLTTTPSRRGAGGERGRTGSLPDAAQLSTMIVDRPHPGPPSPYTRCGAAHVAVSSVSVFLTTYNITQITLITTQYGTWAFG